MLINRMVIIFLFASALFLNSAHVFPQEFNSVERFKTISEAELIKPDDEDWLIWRRTYDSQGHSPLDQINKSNIDGLAEAWRVELEQGPNMATPLVHNGVMFLASAQDSVLALDATTGEQLWEYKHRPTGFPSPRIGIALHGDKVIVPTQNMQVVALKVTTGELIWKHEIETPQHDLSLIHI